VEYLDVYSVITFPVPFHNDSSVGPTYYFTDICAVCFNFMWKNFILL